MFCPDCGTSIESPGKFCPSCGHLLPQRAPRRSEPDEVAAAEPVTAENPPVAVPAPDVAAAPVASPWAQTPLPPAEPIAPVAVPAPDVAAAPVASPWAQTPLPPAEPAAVPAWAQPPVGQPPLGQPPYGAAPYAGPPYGAPPPYAPIAKSGASGRNSLAGVLALIGGAVAIGSAWLPWYMLSSDPLQTAAWGRPVDLTKDLILANGLFLIGAALLVLLCGLLMILGVARSPSGRALLGLGAIVGAIGIGVVEFSAYNHVADGIKTLGSDNIFTYGFALFVGAGAAVVAGLGGLAALATRPARAGSSASGASGLARVVAVVLVATVALSGAAYYVSQNNKTAGPGAGSSLGTTEQPTDSTMDASATPESSPSFLTSGYDTREGAIGDYVEQHSVTYAGDCDALGTGDYCSTLDSAVSENQVVYTVGPIASEPVAWLLLRQTDDGLWYVLDQKPFSASATSPW